MGKYDTYSRQKSTHDQKPKINPIWRGIGFLMMVLIPIGSFLLSEAVLKQNATQGWFPIPTDLLTNIFSDSMIFVKLFLTVVIAVLIYAAFTLLRFLGNVMFGPPRYGPLDSPPIKYNGKIHKAR
jgi:hypothetical protein